MSLFLMLGLFPSLSARDLSLEDYVVLVEENSKDIRKALLNYDLAGVQEKLAKSAFMPVVSGSVGYTRNLIELTESYAVGAVPTVNADTGLYDIYYTDVPANFDNELTFQLGFQQTIFDINALNAIKAVKENKELSNASLEKGRRAILTGAKKLYFQVVLLNEVYEIKKTAQENALENLKNVQAKFENQQLSELDVMQADVNWQMTKPETSLALRNLKLGLSNFRQLAGMDASEEIKLSDSLESVLPPLPEAMADGQILESSVDYEIQTRILRMKEIQVDSEISAFYPTLTASAGFAHNFYNDDVLANYDLDVFKAGLTMNIPLFYGGSRFHRVKQARIENESARLDLLKVQDDLLNEADELLLKLEEARNRIETAKGTWDTAGRAYEIVKLSAENGLSTQLEIKDARLNRENAKLGYLSAVYEYLSYTFDWRQLVGSDYN